MRVLRISHSSVVASWRGREQALGHLGVECTTVTARRWEEGGKEVELSGPPDATVHGARTWGRHPCGFVYSPLTLLEQIRRGWDILDVQEESYSLAAAEVMLLRLLARSKAQVVIYSAQNLDKRRSLPVWLSERLVLRSSAGAYPCSEGAAAILRRRGFRGALRRVPLGVELSGAWPGEARNETQPPRPRVGFIGRIVPEKGVAILLEAARLLPGCEIRVAGAGPQREALEAEARRFGDPGRVRFDGPLEDTRVAAWFAGIDVLAVPSLPRANWTEQFGRVVVEAMAAGVPVVASDTGALPEVVSDAGLLVPPGDPAALARAIRSVLGDSALRSRLVTRGLERSVQCSWSAVADIQHRLYLSVLGSLPAGALERGGVALEAVVVAYGREDLLERALAGLSDPADRIRIVVVDNSSSEAVRSVAEAAGAAYHDPGSNLGFAAAVNRGLDLIGDPTSDVLLLNPDAEVDLPTVRALQRRLHAESRLAAVAPSQTDSTGSSQRVGWPFPSPSGAWWEALGLGSYRRQIDFLVGSVLLLSGEALAEVGRFDERYFLYAEETDWQRRARRAGWGVRYCAELAATHVGGATLQADPERREALFCAGQERYIRAWHSEAGWQVFRAGVVVGALIRAALRPARRAESISRAKRFAGGPLRSLARGAP